MAQPLHADLHGTYRAELRAVAHVVKHALRPVLIRSDNKAVVTHFNKILHSYETPPTHPDYDLWQYIEEIVRHLTTSPTSSYHGCPPDTFYHIKRVPAHLDDPPIISNTLNS